MSLRILLKNDDLKNRFAVIESRATDFLRFWQTHAPHYTDHGKAHCEAVEGCLNELIPDTVKTGLNQCELFTLLCSVFLHDIGMMNKKNGETDETVRNTHHDRCVEVIMTKFEDSLSRAERVVLADVCRAHRLVDLSTLDEVRVVHHPELGNQKIRIQFLASLLRVADACDMCLTRSNPLMDISALVDEARFFHSLHNRVSGISFLADQATIDVHMLVSDELDKLLLSEYVVDGLRSELGSASRILAKNGVYLFFVNAIFSQSPTPLPKIEITPEITKELQARLRQEIQTLLKKDPTLAVDACHKMRLAGGTIPHFIIEQVSRAFESRGDFESSVKTLKEFIDKEPGALSNLYVLNHIAHVIGEFLYDMQASCNYFEKCYELQPDDNGSLNYAEALITIGKYDKAYDIASKVYNKPPERTAHLINALLIQISSLYFMDQKQKAFELVKTLVGMMPGDFYKSNIWVYNKIRRVICGSKLEDPVKNKLLGLIDVIMGKKSVDEFRKAHDIT